MGLAARPHILIDNILYNTYLGLPINERSDEPIVIALVERGGFDKGLSGHIPPGEQDLTEHFIPGSG